MGDPPTGIVDAVVIGGGMAGASVAYELASDRTVALVDMEATLGFHATGRSAAMFLETYGGAGIRALTRGSRAFLEEPPAGFPLPVMTPRPFVQFAGRGRGARLQEVYDEVARPSGGVEMLTAAEVLAECPFVRPGVVEGGLRESRACELDVHALHTGYLRGFRARGGTTSTSSPVTELHWADGLWRVQCGDHTLSTPLVVNAAGAWADVIARTAGLEPVGLTPLRRTAFTISADDTTFAPGQAMLYDVDETFYVKPEGAQLLCSPADRTPCEPGDAKPDDMEIARALERIQEITTLRARSVRSAWAGLRTFSPDGDLVIGFDAGHSGFFWSAGLGGYGIQTAPAASRLAAALVRGQDVPADLRDTGFDVESVSPQRFT